MLLAVHRHLDAIDIEARSLRAGGKITALVVNVHHALLSMLPAVRRRLAALNIEGGQERAGFV